MIARTFLFASIILCFISTIPATAAQEGVPDELVAFVERTAADIDASPLNIPQFKSTKIDNIEDLGKVDGASRYLCWLKTDPNRVGYVAVASDGESFRVLAFSATTLPPQYYLKNLQVPQAQQEPLDFAHANQVSAVADVPLVAATKTSLATEPFDISELAASVSSVLNYVQSDKKVVLFGHAGSQEDSEYTRRFKEDPNSAKVPDDPNWMSFDQERRHVIAGEKAQVQHTSEDKASFTRRQVNAVKPVIRRRLLNPVNARERLEILGAEWMALNAVTHMTISQGMKDAVMLQDDYLGKDDSTIEEDLGLFFRTRGRTVRLRMYPFGQRDSDSVPAILVGPAGIVGVLLGFADMDDRHFAFVFFPRTGTPVKMSLSDKMEEIRRARGVPTEPDKEEQIKATVKHIRETQERYRKEAEEKGIPYKPPIEDPELWVRQSLARYENRTEGSLIVEDRYSGVPPRIENGVHLVDCLTLSSWNVVCIGEIGVDDNWGRPK